jgi:hypothetical protein
MRLLLGIVLLLAVSACAEPLEPVCARVEVPTYSDSTGNPVACHDGDGREVPCGFVDFCH